MYMYSYFLYFTGTPLTPTANLKMLVAAANSALEMENANSAATNSSCLVDHQSDRDDEASSRKMKSLALLCKRLARQLAHVHITNDSLLTALIM